MMDVALYRLSIPFAIVTGCVAGLLAVLLWRIFRESPFEKALKLLIGVMSIATVYHSGLLVLGAETIAVQTLRILGYVLVSITLFVAIVELRDNIWSRDVSEHWAMFLAPVLGLLLYAIGSPLSELYFPPILHWIHGFGALFAVVGLCSPVHGDLQNKPWNELLLDDTRDGRDDPEWLMPVDNAILEVLYASGLVLTPAVIAYNIDYSRSEVNRRLTKLEEEGLVKRVERGKYRLENQREQYMESESMSVT